MSRIVAVPISGNVPLFVFVPPAGRSSNWQDSRLWIVTDLSLRLISKPFSLGFRSSFSARFGFVSENYSERLHCFGAHPAARAPQNETKVLLDITHLKCKIQG